MDEESRLPRAILAGVDGFRFKNSSVKGFFGVTFSTSFFFPKPKKLMVRRCPDGTRKVAGDRVRREAVHQLA